MGNSAEAFRYQQQKLVEVLCKIHAAIYTIALQLEEAVEDAAAEYRLLKNTARSEFYHKNWSAFTADNFMEISCISALFHIYNARESITHAVLEPRQYKNDSIQSKIIPILKMPHFFTTYPMRKKARQIQTYNDF